MHGKACTLSCLALECLSDVLQLPRAPEAIAAEQEAQQAKRDQQLREEYSRDIRAVTELRRYLRKVVATMIAKSKYTDFLYPMDPEEDPEAYSKVQLVVMAANGRRSGKQPCKPASAKTAAFTSQRPVWGNFDLLWIPARWNPSFDTMSAVCLATLHVWLLRFQPPCKMLHWLLLKHCLPILGKLNKT